MKNLIIISLLLFGLNGFGQEYSTEEVKKYVDELAALVIGRKDRKHDDVLRKLESPEIVYLVVDYRLNPHAPIVVSDIVVNKTYGTYRKICNNGNDSDFDLMTKSNNPSLRAYGVWAYMQEKNYKRVRQLIKIEKLKQEKIRWVGYYFGIEECTTYELMKLLLKRNKKFKD